MSNIYGFIAFMGRIFKLISVISWNVCGFGWNLILKSRNIYGFDLYLADNSLNMFQIIENEAKSLKVHFAKYQIFERFQNHQVKSCNKFLSALV